MRYEPDHKQKSRERVIAEAATTAHARELADRVGRSVQEGWEVLP